MSEADEIIRKLNTEQRNYLNRYFAHAPESVTGSMQVIRMQSVCRDAIFLNQQVLYSLCTFQT